MWRFFLEMKTVYIYYQNTNLTVTQNIYEKIYKQLEVFYHWRKNFHKNSSMWKKIIKWLLIANLINLQLYKQMGKSISRADILSQTGPLIKLTKSLVTIPSSLWTRYLIKTIYIPRFALTWHHIVIALHRHIHHEGVSNEINY